MAKVKQGEASNVHEAASAGTGWFTLEWHFGHADRQPGEAAQGEGMQTKASSPESSDLKSQRSLALKIC